MIIFAEKEGSCSLRASYIRNRKILLFLFCIIFFRAFIESIPEDFGYRGDSTITKLPMRNKQWQKHPKTTPR